MLDIAGRYADVLDLNGTSQAGAVRGRDLGRADLQRRLSTTVSGLEASAQRVEEIARTHGRPRVMISLLINFVVFCSESECEGEATRIRENAGLPNGALDECPYVFIGEPKRMRQTLAERQARIGVDSLLLSSAIPRETIERFAREVLRS